MTHEGELEYGLLIDFLKSLLLNRFKVQYKRDTSGHGRDGEILLIVPRKPEDGVTDEEDGSQSTDLYPMFDEPDGLSSGIFLKQEDVDKLTFCCCECCHRISCRECSSWFCKAFPQHTTANQFFTPLMFEAYHREGFRACAEAKADEFINEKQQIENGDRLTGESILV